MWFDWIVRIGKKMREDNKIEGEKDIKFRG